MWTARFEDIPSNDDFGSSTAKAIRDTKSEFNTRWLAGHEVDTTGWTHKTNEPICYIQPSDKDAASNYREGAFQFDATSSILYYDDGAALQEIGGLSHSRYTLHAADTDAHSQYLLVASTGTVWVNSLPYVKGLDIVSADSLHVMARVFHSGEDVSGGCMHDDNVITSATGAPISKFTVGASTSAGTFAYNGSATITLRQYGFIPAGSAYLTHGASTYNAFLRILPHFVGSLGATDYVPQITIMVYLTGYASPASTDVITYQVTQNGVE